MDSPDAWADALKVVCTAIGATAVAVGGFFAGKRKADEAPATQIVAADLFKGEHVVALRLALNGLETAVRAQTALLLRLHDDEQRDEVAELKAELRALGRERQRDQVQRGMIP